MGEAADSWSAYKAAQQHQRSQNREAAPAKLTEAGINFQSSNGGAHLIIKAKGVAIDFWPGTDKWKVRGDLKNRHGIQELIDFCNWEKPKPSITVTSVFGDTRIEVSDGVNSIALGLTSQGIESLITELQIVLDMSKPPRIPKPCPGPACDGDCDDLSCDADK